MTTTARPKPESAILPLAQQHTKMRPVGRLWWGLCPLHEERTPSFYVNPEKDRWYCFGCGKGGDIDDLSRALTKRKPKVSGRWKDIRDYWESEGKKRGKEAK